MSALPAPVARRVDRLALRAHAFHRFAHHPLCDSYAPEVIRIGRRTRVCRGCLLAFAGGAAGTAAGALVFASSPRALMAAFATWAAFALAWAAARGRAVDRGTNKWLARFLPTAGAAGLATLGLRDGSASGIAIALGTAAIVTAALRGYRRSGPDRSACGSCPEAGAPRTCSGLRPIARREAAFRRLACRWIDASLRLERSSERPGEALSGARLPRP